MAVVITCVIHWFIGFFAIYYGNVALFAAVSATFTSLGVLIFLHHTLCHKVVSINAALNQSLSHKYITFFSDL